MVEKKELPEPTGDGTQAEVAISQWEFLSKVPTRPEVMTLLASLPAVWGVKTVDFADYVQALPSKRKIKVQHPTNPNVMVDEMLEVWTLYMGVAGRLKMLQAAAEKNGWRVDFEPEQFTPTGVPGFISLETRIVYREYVGISVVWDDTDQPMQEPVQLGRKPGTAWVPASGGQQAAGSNPYEKVECVPLRVPALTREGWKFAHQITVGDDLLTYSMERGVLEWQPASQVSTFKDQPIVRVGNKRFTADCTPNHRWVFDVGGKEELTEWDQRPDATTGRIRLAAPIDDWGSDRVDDARRLGWLFGDCTLHYRNGLVGRGAIRQSKPENFAAIEAMFGEPDRAYEATERHWDNGRVSPVRESRVWNVPTDEVRRVLGRFGVNSEQDLPVAVLSMSHGEVDAFLDSMMRSDGSGKRYNKTSLPLVQAMQFAFFLDGTPPTAIKERAGNYMTTRPCYDVARDNTASKWLSVWSQHLLPPQPVWCPTTPNGTWVGLFNGRPAITGNTSARGRAIAAWGFGVLPGSGVASVEEIMEIRSNRAHMDTERQPRGERKSRGDLLQELLAKSEEVRQARGYDEADQKARLGKYLSTTLGASGAWNEETNEIDWSKVKDGQVQICSNMLSDTLRRIIGTEHGL